MRLPASPFGLSQKNSPNNMNFERRKFLRAVVLGGAFLFVIKNIVPSLSFRQRPSDGNALGCSDETEDEREITFSDKRGNKVLVVEK